MESEQWLVLLRADGVVDSVEGGAPTIWLGHALADNTGIPEVLRHAVGELVHAASGASYVRRRKVRIDHIGKSVGVEVLLVEGLPLRRSHTRIDELVMRTLDVFASQARSSDIDLTVEQSPNVPAVMAIDGEKVAWALATLVANALRYTQHSDAKGTEPHIRVQVLWSPDEDELVLIVSDNGPGIEEHRARWLFERDPSTGRSAGLGLLMVRDVIVAHRGSVNVASSVGHGTTFTLRIPRIPA